MKKRYLSVLLALILVFVQVPTLVRAEGFKDVKGHWAERTIVWAAKEGYLKGYPDGTFRPDAPVSNAEYYRIVNEFTPQLHDPALSSKDVKVNYSDVKEDDWFYTEVKKGVQAGYLGSGEGQSLKSGEKIERQEAVRIFAVVQKWDDDAEAARQFADYDSVKEELRGAVGASKTHNLIQGYPDGTFRPEGSMTRAEVVTVLANHLHPDLGPEPAPTPSPSGNWNWNFINEPSNFGKGYQINSDVLQRAAKFFNGTDAQEIRRSMRGGWSGSCYGFTATAGLYKEGRLPVNNLNVPARSTIGDLQAQSNYKAQSVINLHQNMQNTRMFIKNRDNNGIAWNFRWVKRNTQDLSTYAANLKAMVDQAKAKNSTVQLGYFWPMGGQNVGHANAIYDYVQEGNVLRLKVYDPNYIGLDQKEVVIDLGTNRMVAKSATTASGGSGRIVVAYSYAFPTNTIMKGANPTPTNTPTQFIVKGKQKVAVKSGSESWVLDPKNAEVVPDEDTYIYTVPAKSVYKVYSFAGGNIAIRGKDYYLAFETERPTAVEAGKGTFHMKDQTGKYWVSMGEDATNRLFKWNAVEVEGSGDQDLYLNKDPFGYALRGENLKGARVTALDKFVAKEKTVDRKAKVVQIRQDNDQLKFKYDEFGKYDQKPGEGFVGSWIGHDYIRKPSTGVLYNVEATFRISKNPNGTYLVRKTGRVVETGDYFVGEHRNVRLNPSTGELELRRSNYVSLEGLPTKGANKGPELENGRLVVHYVENKVAEYTRY